MLQANEWVGLDVDGWGSPKAGAEYSQVLNLLHPGFSFKGGSFLSGRSGDPSRSSDPTTPWAAPPWR